MIHFFINACAASAGGGITYVRNVIPHIGARPEIRATVLVSSALRPELGSWPNLSFMEAPEVADAGARFWFEQCKLPGLIRRSRANVLLSTGNFALWNSPVPQILLSRNALYTSADFIRDLRRRGDYRLWLDTLIKAELAKRSIQRAEITVAPSAAFANELREWTGKEVVAVHHGFDADAFTHDHAPLPQPIQDKLDAASGNLRLLFVSHYNYYRNFETLIGALPLLRDRLAPRKVSLVLTCRLRSEANPGSYRADSASKLVRDLGVAENVIELGSVPYSLLHQVYRACDIYVTPAYAESFAHPLVEAMSSGLPVVASDIPVHQEICGSGGVYFHRCSARSAADLIARVAASAELRRDISMAGKRRSSDFSWRCHVDNLVTLGSQLFHQQRQ